MPVHDLRRWDFSIIDDEFTDDPRLTPSDRAAYLSIVRHARMTGDTDEPAGVLMASAGIASPETWRQVRADLADHGYIRVEEQGPQRPPRIYLLPVQKARVATPQKITTTGGGAKNRPPHGGFLGGSPQNSTSLLSGDSEDREKSAPCAGTRKASEVGDRLRLHSAWPDFRRAYGRDPETQAELEAFVKGTVKTTPPA